MSGAMATSRSLLVLLVLFAVVAHSSVACNPGGGGAPGPGGCQPVQCCFCCATGHGGCPPSHGGCGHNPPYNNTPAPQHQPYPPRQQPCPPQQQPCPPQQQPYPPQHQPPQHQPYPPQHQPSPPQQQPYPPQHQPYPPNVPAPRPCPIDALKLDLCVDVLSALSHLGIGQVARAKCCPLLQGVDDQDAALCLCTTIQAHLLNTDLAMNLLVDCGKQPPHGFQCPPLHAATTTAKKVGRHPQLGG